MLTPIGGGHCKVNYHFYPAPEFSQPRMEHTRAELVFLNSFLTLALKSFFSARRVEKKRPGKKLESFRRMPSTIYTSFPAATTTTKSDAAVHSPDFSKQEGVERGVGKTLFRTWS